LFLHKNKVGLYRVHEEPASDKLENFIALANRMGFAIKEFKDSIAINAFLQKTKEHPESYLLSTMLLRSMQQAYYHSENFGHYGLGFSHYTHFTSPIRRYPDLVVHRLIKKLKKYESDSKLVDTAAFLTEACKTSSEKERQAVDMERAIKRRKSIHFLKDNLGETFAGIVSGVTERGIYAALTYTGIEGMVLESLLEGFEYDDERKEFRRGKTVIRLGTLVRVRLVSMNLHRELIDFQWIENLEHEG
ncbi:MAG: ribonuclease R, partial [Spirochaetae bacterium HGW-Spirochaetae-6]